MIRTIISTLAATALLYGSLNAQAMSTGRFLAVTPDPQTAAVGNNPASTEQSPAGFITNPALSAFLDRAAVTAAVSYFPGYTFLANSTDGASYTAKGDMINRFAGVAVPLSLGTIGLAGSYQSYADNAQWRTGAGVGVEAPATARETIITLNYAVPIRTNYPVFHEYGSLGLNLKMISGTLGDYATQGFAVDIGGIFKGPFIEGLTTSLAYRNIGSDLSYSRGKDNAVYIVAPEWGMDASLNNNDLIVKMTPEIDAGIEYLLPFRYRFAVMANVAKPPYALFSAGGHYAVGASIAPFYPLTLRTSWFEADDRAHSGFRGGLGLDFGPVTIGYTVATSRDFAPEHYIGIDYRFGGITDIKRASSYYLDAYFREAADKYQKRDYIGARMLLEEILSIYPDHRPSQEHLEKISNELDAIKQKEQIEISKFLRKANVAIGRNNLFEARKYYQYALQIDPQNEFALDGQRKIDDMITEMENRGKVNSEKERVVALWNEAMAYYSRGEFVSAKEKFNEVLVLNPENAEATQYLVEIDRQLAKINQLQINDLFNKAMDLFNAGNFTEAAKFFNAVAVAAPERIDAQTYLVESQNRLKEAEKKRIDEERSAKEGKQKEELNNVYAEAVALYKGENYEEAIKAFSKARDAAQKYNNQKYIEYSKNYIVMSRNALADKHYKLGFEYSRNNKFESAISEYRKTLEYNPDNVVAKGEIEKLSDALAQQYYEQGMKYFSNGEQEKAKERLRKALQYKPDMVEASRALERL